MLKVRRKTRILASLAAFLIVSDAAYIWQRWTTRPRIQFMLRVDASELGITHDVYRKLPLFDPHRNAWFVDGKPTEDWPKFFLPPADVNIDSNTGFAFRMRDLAPAAEAVQTMRALSRHGLCSFMAYSDLPDTDFPTASTWMILSVRQPDGTLETCRLRPDLPPLPNFP